MTTDLSRLDFKVELGEATEVFELPVAQVSPERKEEPLPSPVDNKEDSRTFDSPDSGVTVYGLPPIDGGWRAWTFVISGFALETFVWGFSYR